MFKNLKMRLSLTIVILSLTICCICMLYFTAKTGMQGMMEDSAVETMQRDLNAQSALIQEYVDHQEDLLKEFSIDPIVKDYLKDLDNPAKQKELQAYTEIYYQQLDNWEGLYVAEWDTHVIAHSNPEIVGMYTREGDPMIALQNAMEQAQGLYNAGIIVSPASQKLTLSMYCPVYDNGRIIGYVGGGPFADNMDDILKKVKTAPTTKYIMINVAEEMYIFHEDETLIANQIQDEMTLTVIEQIRANSESDSGVVYYTKAGEEVIISYKVDAEHKWAVLSKVSEKDLFAEVRVILTRLAVICIVSSVSIGALSWFTIFINTRPLKDVTKAILDLKDLKISKAEKLNKFIGCKGEIGQISTALDSLTDSLKEITETLDECSVSLSGSAKDMSDSACTLIQCVEDNAIATEIFAERASCMNETVMTVNDGVRELSEAVAKVEEYIQTGTEKGNEVMSKVMQIQEIANQSPENANLYHASVEQMKEIVRDMRECSRVFEQATLEIRRLIDSIQSDSINGIINTDDMLAKVSRTREAAEEMSDIVVVNEQNAAAIRAIVERFVK